MDHNVYSIIVTICIVAVTAIIFINQAYQLYTFVKAYSLSKKQVAKITATAKAVEIEAQQTKERVASEKPVRERDYHNKPQQRYQKPYRNKRVQERDTIDTWESDMRELDEYNSNSKPKKRNNNRW